MLTQKQVMWGKFISLTLLLVVFCAGIFFVFNTSRASEKNIEQNITLNNETKEGEESTLLPASSETQNSSTNEISNSLLVSGDDNADASTGDDVANAAKNDLYVYVIDVNGHLSSITLDYIYKYSSMETEKYSQDFTITNFSEYTNPFQPYTEETNPCGRTNPAWEGETIKEVRIRGVSTNENGYYISEIRTEVASFESLIIGENPALYESYNASDHNNFVPEFWVNHTDSPLVVVWISTSPKTYTLSFKANGGSGSMSSQTFTFGVAQNISPCGFTAPAGKVFAGWYHQTTAGPTNYYMQRTLLGVTGFGELYSDQSYISLTSSNYFFAIWANVITLDNSYHNSGLQSRQLYEYIENGYWCGYRYGDVKSPILNAGDTGDYGDEVDGNGFESRYWHYSPTVQAHPGYNNNNGYWYHPEDSSLGAPGIVVTERKTVDGYLYYIARRGYVGQNTTVYAHYYNPKIFTLTLVGNNGLWGNSANLSYSLSYWEDVTRDNVEYKHKLEVSYPTRPGYIFTFSSNSISGGWSVTNNSANCTLTFTCDNPEDATFTPEWTAATYKLVYHKFENNSTSIDSGSTRRVQTLTYNTLPITIAMNDDFGNNKFVMGKWVFKGWATSFLNSQKGIVVYDKQNRTVSTNLKTPTIVNNVVDESASAVHLYAVWALEYNLYAYYNTAANPTTYSFGSVGGVVKFNDESLDNADEDASQEFWMLDSNYAYVRPNVDAIASTGYTFVGWYRKTDQSAGITFSGDDITGWGTSAGPLTPVTSTSQTLSYCYDVPSDGAEWYARFDINSYDITVNINGNAVNQVYDSTYGYACSDPYGEVTNVSGSFDSGRSVSTGASSSWSFKYYYGTAFTLTFAEKTSNGLNLGHYTGFTQSVSDAFSYDANTQTLTLVDSSGVVTQNLTLNLTFIPVWNSEVVSVTIKNGETFTFTGGKIVPSKSQFVVTNELTGAIIDDTLYSTRNPTSGNNTNAGTAYFEVLSTNANAYYFVDLGDGVINSVVIATFTILAKNIDDDDCVFELAGTEFTYTGSEITPGLNTATYNGDSISYDINPSSYANNINVSRENNTSTGTVIAGASVTIEGTGNYTGTKTLAFTIVPADISNADTNEKYTKDYYFTGLAIDPSKITFSGVTVTYGDGDLALEQGRDFVSASVADQNYIEARDGKQFKIVGQGNFTGEKELGFNIKPLSLTNDEDNGYKVVWKKDSNTDIEDATVVIDTGTVNSYVYDGTARTPTVGNGIEKLVLTINGLGSYPFATSQNQVTYNLGNAPGNYELRYVNNTNVTTDAEIIVRGNVNLTGSATIYFAITKKNIDGAIWFSQQNSVEYNRSVQTPSLATDGYIKSSDFSLAYYATSGADTMHYGGFTLVYSNNEPTWTFNNAGIFTNANIYYLDFVPNVNGNYGYYDDQGNEINEPYRLTYTIPQRDASSYISVSFGSKEITYDGQSHTPIITISDGSVLTTDDYVIEYAVGNVEGTYVQTPVPSVTNVDDYTIYIRVKTKLNQPAGVWNYTENTWTSTLKITPLTITFGSGASSAVLVTNSFTYDGQAHTPSLNISVVAGSYSRSFENVNSGTTNIGQFFTFTYNNNIDVTRENNASTGNVLAGASVTISALKDSNNNYIRNFAFTDQILYFTIQPRSVVDDNNYNLLVINNGTNKTFNKAFQFPTFAYNNDYNLDSSIFSGNLSNDIGIMNAMVDVNDNRTNTNASFADLAIAVEYRTDATSFTSLGTFSENHATKFKNAGIYKLVFTGQNNYTNSFELLYYINAATITSIDYAYRYTDINGQTVEVTTNGKNTDKVYNANDFVITKYILGYGNGQTFDLDPSESECTPLYSQAKGTSGASVNRSQNINDVNWKDANYWNDLYNPITVVVSGVANYNESPSFEFRIRPYDWTATFPKNFVKDITDVEYTGGNIEPTISFNTTKSGASAYLNILSDLNDTSKNYYSLSYANNSTVGQATITVTPTTHSNYAGSNSFTVNFNIVKFKITSYTVVTNYSTTSFVYDNQPHGAELGAAGVGGISFEDGQHNTVTIYQNNGGTFTFAYVRQTGDSSSAANVGTFTMSVTSFSSDLYEFANEMQKTNLTYSITQRPFSVNFINWGWDNTVTYDGFYHTINPQVTDSGLTLDLINAGQVSVSGNGQYLNAGDYPITITLDTSKNYMINTNETLPAGISRSGDVFTKTFTISKKQFSAATVGIIVNGGNNVVYDGTEKKPGIVVYDKEIKNILDSQTPMGVDTYVITIDSACITYSAVNNDFINANENTPRTVRVDITSEGITSLQNYEAGAAAIAYIIYRKEITDLSITVSIPDAMYNHGEYIQPDETIRDTARNADLTVYNGTAGDYTIGVINLPNGATDAGNYTVQIDGQLNYTGTRYETFVIKKAVIGDTLRMEFVLSDDSFVFNNDVQKPDVHINIYRVSDDSKYGELDISSNSTSGEISYVDPLNDSTTAFIYARAYKVQFNGNTNYELVQGITDAEHSTTYTITKKPLEVSMFNTNCGSTFVFDNTNVNKAVVNYAEFNGLVLSSTDDYVVSYARLNEATNQWESVANNSSTGFVDAGTMKLIVTAPNNSVNFEGSAEIPYTINQRHISNAFAQLVAGPFVYDGQPQRPAIDSISDSAIGLADLAGNYKVNYKISATNDNEPVNAGTGYLAVIEGIGNYKGFQTLNFNISKATINTNGVYLVAGSNYFDRASHFTRILIDHVTTNTINITSSDYTYSFHVAADPTSAAPTDYVNVGTIYVYVTAKNDSINFEGTGYTTYTIAPRVIDQLSIANDSGDVFNNQSWLSTINSRAEVYANGLSLQQAEYTFKFYRGTNETNDLTTSGNIKVEVWANTANTTNFVDGSTKPFTTFTIHRKVLNVDNDPANNIEVKFYYVDDDTEFDLSSQTYVGRALYPVVKYYYSGTNYVTLVQGASSSSDDYYFENIPTSWTDASTAQYNFRMTLYITANSTNYQTTGSGIIFTYVIQKAPWSTEHITITICAQTYTGSPIRIDSQSMIVEAVYDNAGSPINLLLGTDFIVDTSYNSDGFTNGYSNNTNASTSYNTALGEWEAQAMVAFKAINPNYDLDQTLGVSFVIRPFDISSSTFNLSSNAETYNAQDQEPQVENLVYNTMPLQKGTDYVVLYNGDRENKPHDAGVYAVTIQGKGNYQGSLSTTFTINKKSLADLDVLVTLNPDTVTYSGEKQTPTIASVVMLTNVDLAFGVDYDLNYEYKSFIESNFSATTLADGFVDAGLYHLILTPASANFSDNKTVTYTINRAGLSSLEPMPSSVVYNGTNQQPVEAQIVVNAGTNTNIPHTAIEFSYQVQISNIWESTNNPDFVNAGTIRIVARADDLTNVNFEGSCYFDFVIGRKALTNDNITVDDSNCVYDRIEQYATVTVVDMAELQEGTDYALAWSGDLINAGHNQAIVTITGQGNYEFTIPVNYSIQKRNINTLTYVETVIPEPEFTGYNFANDLVNQFVGILKHGSHNLDSTEFSVVFAQNSVVDAGEYGFSLNGIGNNYEGTIENLTFEVVARSLTNAYVSIEFPNGNDEFSFTGEAIEPTIRVVDSDSNVLKTNVDASNFDITYENNINVDWSDDSHYTAGAKVIVAGKNNYADTIFEMFTILPINIADADITKMFDGEEVLPTGGNYILKPQLFVNKEIQFTTNTADAKLKLLFNGQSLVLHTVYQNNQQKTEGDNLSDLASVTISIVQNEENIKNFVGTLTMYFAITDLSILMADISWPGSIVWVSGHEYGYVIYNAFEQKLEPTFTYEGVPLVKNQDYVVTYTNDNDDENGYADYVDVTRTSIVVSITCPTGSRFGGSLSFRYDIKPFVINSTNTTVSGNTNETFTGGEITKNKNSITLTVQVGDVPVILDSDQFEIGYENNVNAGSATMNFTFPQNVGITQAVNNFSGSLTSSFTIDPKQINDETAIADGIELFYQVGDVRYNIDEYTPTYTGTAIEPQVVLKYYGNEYFAPDSFTLSHASNIDVMRLYDSLTDQYTVLKGASAIINASAISNGNFTGTLTILFKIMPKLVTQADFTYTLEGGNLVYDGIAYEPEFSLLKDLNNISLTSNDYRILGYENNTNASTDLIKGKIIVEFIKNYTAAGNGKIAFPFDILPFDLTNAEISWNTLVGHEYDGESHNVEVELWFFDRLNNKQFINSYNRYATREVNDVEEETNDLVHAGDVVLYVEGYGNFTGEKHATLTIARVDISLLDVAVETDPNFFVFKNVNIEPAISTSYNGHSISEALGDYVISFVNNKNVTRQNGQVVAGAYIVLTAQSGGNVYGTRQIPFTITPVDLSGATIDIGAQTEFDYTGLEINPEQIILSFTSLLNPIDELGLNVDYTLSYSNKIMPGIVTITATGIGNFDGVKVATYTILPRSFEYVEFEWIDDVSNIVFDRMEHTPRFKLTYKKGAVEEELTSSDFECTPSNNLHASQNATIENKPKLVIKGKGGYAGAENEITKYFEIQPYDIEQLLTGRKLTNRKTGTGLQAQIQAEINSILIYKMQGLSENKDYTLLVSGTGAQLYVDVGTMTFEFTGINDFTGSGTLTMKILEEEINNIILTVDGINYPSLLAQLTYKGSEFNVEFVVRAGDKVVGEQDYDVTFSDELGNVISAESLNVQNGSFKVLNAGTINILIEGKENFIGTKQARFIVLRKDVASSDLELEGIVESFVYAFGVPQEQSNAKLTLNGNDLIKDTDFTVKYFNNAYAGTATMMFVGKGNFFGYKTVNYTITKRASTVDPYFENRVYFAGEILPVLMLRTGSTGGSVLWDILSEDVNTKLGVGVQQYAWTFYPNDSANMLEAHGVLTVEAQKVAAQRITLYGNYKTEYYVFDKFDTSNINVYLIYNNGTNKLLDASEYSINVAHGDEVFVGTVPVVTYEDEDQKLSVMLNITVSKVKLGIEFENTDKIIQQEQAQYITPKITNAVENHAPSIITRYYSQAIGAYTDGITQSGVYVISVTLIGNDYEFEGENTITVYVQTGILKSNDGKVVVIDPQGFENGVRVTVREYTSTSQLDGIIDLRTFNVKKCYEIQLWKDGEEYFSSHMLTIRFNLGRDVLESNKISVLQIPSDTDIYYECEYETVDRDNIELSSKVLGAFVFGEKVEFVSSSWWIALVVGLVILASVTVSVMILITKRRKRRKIANGINVKLGRR